MSLSDAQTAFEAADEVRVIFERGNADELQPTEDDPEGDLGLPAGTFERTFTQWPPASVVTLRLNFNEDGGLRTSPPSEEESASSFDHDPAAGQRTLGGSQPFYDWTATPHDYAVVFVGAVLTEDTFMMGSGSIDLWIKSTALDADLEVILSEVRPDGEEMYVQAGWLRASQRFLAPNATELRPVKTHVEADTAPLDRHDWNYARIELMPFSHIFRSGSRIRIQIDTPGDSRERWRFMLTEYVEDTVTHFVSHSLAYPSSVALPYVPGIDVPTDLPDCPSLRGQPCRSFDVGYVNRLEDPQVRNEADFIHHYRGDETDENHQHTRIRRRRLAETDDAGISGVTAIANGGEAKPYVPGRSILKDWPERLLE